MFLDSGKGGSSSSQRGGGDDSLSPTRQNAGMCVVRRLLAVYICTLMCTTGLDEVQFESELSHLREELNALKFKQECRTETASQIKKDHPRSQRVANDEMRIEETECAALLQKLWELTNRDDEKFTEQIISARPDDYNDVLFIWGRRQSLMSFVFCCLQMCIVCAKIKCCCNSFARRTK